MVKPNEFTKEDLKEFQAEPLADKIQRSLAKIGEWYSRWDGEVYVSFSGGKDSSVLADLCAFWCKVCGRTLYLVFVDTGLEYPEIRQHVKFFAEWLREKYGIKVELEILRPELRFDEVIKKHGYPVISKEISEKVRKARKNVAEGNYSLRLCQLGVKETDYGGLCNRENRDYEESAKGSLYSCAKYRPLIDVDFELSEQCCIEMKKNPAREYENWTGRKPILAQLAEESRKRRQAWLRTGCNAFYTSWPQSNPMGFWRNQDVLEYIFTREMPISTVYGDVVYMDEPDQIRIEELTGQDIGCDKLCTTGCARTGCIFCGFGAHTDKGETRFERLKRTHPRQYAYCIGGGEYNEAGVWQPNKKGLGLGHVFDELNRIYGEGFIRY